MFSTRLQRIQLAHCTTRRFSARAAPREFFRRAGRLLARAFDAGGEEGFPRWLDPALMALFCCFAAAFAGALLGPLF
jgi:hypothetical protein